LNASFPRLEFAFDDTPRCPDTTRETDGPPAALGGLRFGEPLVGELLEIVSGERCHDLSLVYFVICQVESADTSRSRSMRLKYIMSGCGSPLQPNRVALTFISTH
jgi:hypothetical protein